MSSLPHILLIDNNPTNERLINKIFELTATITTVTNVQQASEAITSETIDAVLINADTYSINAAITCAWLKADPVSSQLSLIVLSQDKNNLKELKYFESGADEVIYLPAPQALIKHKVLRHTQKINNRNILYLAANALNQFYENTYSNTSLSHCMQECIDALQAMNLKAALQVYEHPELTCSSFGSINDYEKALLNNPDQLHPAADSARFTYGNEIMSILVQNMPNAHHPLHSSLIGWIKKIFKAISQKAEELLSPQKQTSPIITDIDIPQTESGAQRLHYYVEKALNQMERSCEQEINRSIGRVDEITTWRITPKQKRHAAELKDNLLQLKENLLTNCLEIESRYLQFITERRAKTRLNLGW